MDSRVHPAIGTGGGGPAPLSVAAQIVRSLTDAGVRFGVYKNAASVPLGLAGRSDLDLLVAAGDIEQARQVLTAAKGIRGAPSRFHDNAASGREDWFVPDDRGGFLHLDLAIGLRVGPKYRKRYLALDYDDVADWRDLSWDKGSLRIVSPREEARIAVLRALFRLRARPGERWVAAEPGLARSIGAAWLQEAPECTLRYCIGAEEIAFRLRRRGELVELEAASIKRLRAAIGANNGVGPLSALTDWPVHRLRQSLYLMIRWLTRSNPARTATKRSPVPGGMVVAVVGPDGAGKSTQTKRLSEMFQRKFRCSALYLGSNRGGFAMRRSVGMYRDAQRRRRQAHGDAAEPATAHGSPRGMTSAAWRLIVALQRYLGVRKAMRLARSGAIVITDRWPQNVEAGILDGPSILAPDATWLRRLLSTMERFLYRRMERFRPSLTIHLLSDFHTSDARKPGEIHRDAIERRLSLMQRMRDSDPAIVLVDSRQDMEEVTNQLFRNVWFALWVQSAAAGRRAASQCEPMRRAHPSVGHI